MVPVEALPDSPGAVVVVDVANVMGSRADGWWRDRAGAALRLYREVAELAARGVPAGRLPAGLAAAGPVSFVLVLEGRAREAAARLDAAHPQVRVVSAAGSGDDSIVTETACLVASGASCLVVTADRELRRRCAAEGASVTGPSWLLGLLQGGNIEE
jgi:8-oxo-dGTP diphosphatase